MMRRTLETATLAALLFASPASALDPAKALTQYARDAWGVEEGLPQSSVIDLLQSRDGYVWMATEEGLVRFDGVAFTVFDARSVPALTSAVVVSVDEDSEGTVWAGTVGGELMRIKGGVADVPVPTGQLDGDVTAVVAGRASGLWVGMDQGNVYRYDNGRLDKVLSAAAEVTDLLEEKDGTLWIGTRQALLRRRGTSVEPMGAAQGFPEGGVGSLTLTRGGVLHVGFPGAVCTVRGAAVSCLGAAAGVPPERVEAVLEDREGNLWLATNGAGLARVSGGRVTVLGESDGLPAANVRTLLEDREGGLWVGMQGGGALRLRDGAVTPFGVPEGLCADIVWSATEDGAGRLWVGTHGGGMCRMDGGVARTFRAKDGLPSDFVYVVTPAGDGGVWAGTTKGLAHVKGDTVTPEPMAGIGPPTLLAVFEDSRGRLFAGGRGLAVRDGGVFRALRQADGLPSEFISGFMEDAQGHVWVMTRKGIVRYADGGLQPAIGEAQGLPHGAVVSMSEDVDGTLWIATDAGLARRYPSGRITTYTKKQGLHLDSIMRLLDDGRGFLWLSTAKGIVRVAKSELDEIDAGRRTQMTQFVLGRADGMRHPECNGGFQNAGTRMRDGRLMFPNLRGLAIVDPSHLPRNEIPPLLAVQSIVAGGVSEVPGEVVVLPPDRRRLEIHYAGLSFNVPSRVRFRYRLDGFDSDWTDAGTRRTAYYTGLKPGEYTFRVAAVNENGVASQTEARARLRLLPRFRETWPFFALCAGAIGLVGYATSRLRGRQLRARSAELERLVALRTAELQGAQAQIVQSEKMASLGQMVAGVAHEINNPINFISGASENLRIKTTEFRGFLAELMGEEAQSEVGREVDAQLDELGKMIQTIRNGTERVKKIVLSLRSFSRLDEADFKEVDLHEGIESTLEILMFKFKDRIRLVRDYGQLPLVECNASQINQVVMNLVVNATQAIEGDGTITIRTGMDGPGFVHVDVSDTGSGIPADKLEKVFDPFYTTKKVGEGTGLGLSISYGIVKEHGGEIRVTSKVGEGTTFRIRLPVAAHDARTP